ncbi:hypothetical protein DFJ73DRAFT_271487 [Zopfochytrium polystomum]|nr:hypothetical protein DFJ73DRAFT_271487 [Zopfochytrium polystomum]
MVKYRDRGFATAVFDICRHDPRCDVRATASIRSIIQRAFPEKLVNRSHGPNVRTDAFPVPLDPDDNPGLGPPLKHLRLIGMDYVPAPLVYGEIIGASELCEQIKILESGRYEFDVERNDIRKFTPVLRRLPYAITSDPIKFSNCLMDPQGKLIAMQFKFVKDGWLDRRLYVATALQFCYMCKKGVEAGLQAERNTHEPQSPRHDDELDEDEEYWDDSPSEWDDGSEADSSPESAQHPAARTSVSPGDEYDSFSEQSIVERHPRLPTPAPRQIPLCPTCAAINAQKRAETTELRGATAVVVGGQRKVGRCVVLRLLRMGATVHATTQLPRLLLAALRKEPDAEAWWDRVRVHQLDLTDAGAVVRLAQWMASSLPRLDMLVQLAAQKAVRQEARRWQRLAAR